MPNEKSADVKETTLSIRMNRKDVDLVKDVAHRHKLAPSTYARVVLMQAVEHEKKMIEAEAE